MADETLGAAAAVSSGAAASRGTSARQPWTVAVLIALSLPIALYGLAFSFAPDLNPELYLATIFLAPTPGPRCPANGP